MSTEASTGPTTSNEHELAVARKRQKTGRVRLNVGGTCFETSVTTLTGASSFFSCMFSRWEGGLDDEDIFIDRDADSFRVLLSCMRQGTAVLPALDHDLCARVLLDARYLGVDSLLQSVKAVAWRNMHPLETAACAEDDTHCATQFDTAHASVEAGEVAVEEVACWPQQGASGGGC